MSSSTTGSTRADAGDGNVDAAAELERTVERLNQGIVVTYELRAETDEPVEIEATATEAADAADELRTEVAGLREEVDEALGLREQLLGALQNAGRAAGSRAITADGEEHSADAAE